MDDKFDKKNDLTNVSDGTDSSEKDDGGNSAVKGSDTNISEEGTYSYKPEADKSVFDPKTGLYSEKNNTSSSTDNSYSSYNVNSGDGGISYAPNNQKPKKAPRKKRGNGAFATVMIICMIFLSTGFGVIGAYIANTVMGENTAVNNNSTSTGENSVVIYRPATEDEDKTPAEDAGNSTIYASVAAKAADSVVAITTEFKTAGFWEYVTSGAGSGVVISADGYIITNHHVISNDTKFADKVTVTMANGKSYNATLVGGNSKADIAVIKVNPDEGEVLIPAVFADSSKLVVGEEVVAIGNPLGELSGTVTNGIISALAREITVDGVTMNLLQTNAAINPGNSGGGLFNMNGDLVGIVNAKSSGTGIEGLGFAIPANDALEKATAIINGGGGESSGANVKIGIKYADVFTAAAAKKLGVSSYGVYIVEVEEGYNDGVLMPLDRVLVINNQEVSDGASMLEIVQNSQPGDKLEFMIVREGRLKSVEVTCYPVE